MMLAKYKKHFRDSFVFWLIWACPVAMRWIVEGDSPLVWQNAWGVIDWLGWSGTISVIFVIATHELGRDLPLLDEAENLLLLLRYAARWLLGVAILAVVTIARLWFYAWRAHPEVQLRHYPESLKLSIVLFIVEIGIGFAIIACRMIALFLRAYRR